MNHLEFICRQRRDTSVSSDASCTTGGRATANHLGAGLQRVDGHICDNTRTSLDRKGELLPTHNVCDIVLAVVGRRMVSPAAAFGVLVDASFKPFHLNTFLHQADDMNPVANACIGKRLAQKTLVIAAPMMKDYGVFALFAHNQSHMPNGTWLVGDDEDATSSSKEVHGYLGHCMNPRWVVLLVAPRGEETSFGSLIQPLEKLSVISAARGKLSVASSARGHDKDSEWTAAAEPKFGADSSHAFNQLRR